MWYVAHQGKLKELINVDGTKAILFHKEGKVMRVLINAFQEIYIITDGSGKYARGKMIKEANEDLIYKIIDQNMQDCEHITLEDTLTIEEAIAA